MGGSSFLKSVLAKNINHQKSLDRSLFVTFGLPCPFSGDFPGHAPSDYFANNSGLSLSFLSNAKQSNQGFISRSSTLHLCVHTCNWTTMYVCMHVCVRMAPCLTHVLAVILRRAYFLANVWLLDLSTKWCCSILGDESILLTLFIYKAAWLDRVSYST